ncbi:hypothetical protein BDY19DRAFT_901053, partial [Irpex rosettiformis]
QIRDWVPFRPWYLDEMIRRDGLGDETSNPSPCCKMCPPTDSNRPASFRCMDCDGCSLLCEDCMVRDHRCRCLHAVERWNGKYFERTSLSALGLIVHLGHHGEKCPNAGRQVDKFIVGHVNGFHEVNVIFCACVSEHDGLVPDWAQLMRYGWFPATRQRIATAFTFRMLEFFHELTLQAKTSLHDFHKTLSRITDNSGVGTTRNCYKQLTVVMRQWRNLKLFKRNGRGHESKDMDTMKEGSCVVECAACPHPGRNLPENWADAPSHIAWMYVLYLMLDANFRLKLKDRGFHDVDLIAGCGYFVEDTKYQAFLREIGDQHEVNTCSAEHKAIRNANVPHGGYLASGTAACLCNRHLLVRANGLADLQKGEKYCSMDYILLCTLIGTSVAVFLTYDIACQYSKHFARRVAEFPPCMRLDVARVDSIRWAIPKKHWRVHGEKGHSQFSLNYLPYSGRTYGEGIETGWSHMNPVSMSTKEMAPSSRREVIDDHWNSWNWQKTLGFGTLFLRNLRTAREMCEKQEAIFSEFTRTFPSEMIARWQAKVEHWEANPSLHDDPFVEDAKAMTLKDIKLKLATEEALDVAHGIPSPHEVSASAFLQIGLELEDAQCALRVRAKERRSVADLATLQTKRNTLANRIIAWRKIQEVYMPCTVALLNTWTASNVVINHYNDNNSDGDDVVQAHAEEIPLFLPSSLPFNLRSDNSLATLLEKEGRLRLAIADDSLTNIRRLRRTMAGISQFKQVNVSGAGQKSNTRIQNLFSRFKDRVTAAAMRYRAAYAALNIIQPPGDWTTRLQVLADKDITGPGKDDDEQPLGEGHHEISWIWRIARLVSNNSADEVNVEEFNQSMEIEWMKTRARARRWSEEVQLIQEEMRRVIDFFEWKAKWWHQRVGQRENVTLALSSGLAGYAEKQASMYEELSLKFYNMWVPDLMIHHLLAQSVTARAASQTTQRHQIRDPVEQSSDDDQTSDSGMST